MGPAPDLKAQNSGVQGNSTKVYTELLTSVCHKMLKFGSEEAVDEVDAVQNFEEHKVAPSGAKPFGSGSIIFNLKSACLIHSSPPMRRLCLQ